MKDEFDLVFQIYPLLNFNHFSYTFLFFAWSVWPALLPYSLYAMEENEQRKKFIYYLYIIGLGIGSASLYTLYSGQPFAYISSFHIDYPLASPQSNNAFVSMYEIFYVLCTLAPMFISSVKNMKVFGILNVMALCISYIFLQIQYLVLGVFLLQY